MSLPCVARGAVTLPRSPGIHAEEVHEDPESGGLRVVRVVARCERAWPFVAAVEVEVYASGLAPVTRVFLRRDEVTGRERRRLLRRVEERDARDAEVWLRRLPSVEP